ncbi:MAG: ABC transporter ATP-binding protein [Bacteroidales bacterium]|nr:ABC transporter ATP-binding protein [Bacteroidales bacterium]
MAQNHIECISLTMQYFSKKNTVTAVDNISMNIGRNELVLLKGRSGAGKSTLLSLMCGLIKPTQGKVIIDNECISEMSDNSLSSLLSDKIGIIFQSFNLLPTYTVFENIEIAMVPKGLHSGHVRDNIFSLLEHFNLKDKAELMPSELSAGQQQKVAIIRTLIKQPSVIFADEPTGSVDDETAKEILEHLIHLKNDKEVTLVIATHGNIPEKFADRLFIIENGRLKK